MIDYQIKIMFHRIQNQSTCFYDIRDGYCWDRISAFQYWFHWTSSRLLFYLLGSKFIRYANASFISLDKLCSKIARPIFHDSPKIWPIFQFTMWCALQLVYYIAEFSTIILLLKNTLKFGAILKTSWNDKMGHWHDVAIVKPFLFSTITKKCKKISNLLFLQLKVWPTLHIVFDSFRAIFFLCSLFSWNAILWAEVPRVSLKSITHFGAKSSDPTPLFLHEMHLLQLG